tara:strand:+ start:3021 stop:3275 length:255 start_codon:yes stop_codon:yes gene_type:complete
MKPIALALFTIFYTPGLNASDKARPNIICLMLDEWGYFESGHMGHRELITPNIDRFASEGMRFRNAYAGQRTSNDAKVYARSCT